MKLRLLLLLLGGLLVPAMFNLASAQDVVGRVGVCDPTPYSAHYCTKPNSDGSLNVTGSFSATLSGFTPNGNVANLAVTTASANVALPAGTVVAVSNTGATAASVKLSVGAGTAATTDFQLQPGATVGLTVGSNTFLNAITASSTTSLSLAGGTGLVTGYGGGGGGGSGGNVNINQVGGNSTAVGNGVTTTGTQRVTLSSDSTGTVAATQSGTWNVNNVSGTVSLPTGAATAANQTTGNTSLSTIATNTTGAATGTNVTETHGTVAAGTAATKSDLIGGVFNTSLPTLTTGQQAALQTDSSGRLIVNIGAGSSSGAVAQGSTTSGQSVVPMGCRTLTSAPTDTTAQTNMPSCDTAGALRVNVTTATGVAQGSTTSGQTVSPIGARTLSTTPTDTTAQTNMPVANLNGSLVVLPYALPDVLVSGTTAAMTGTTSTSLIAAPGAGLHNYITNITCANSHATVGTFVTVQDGSGGTALYTVPAAAVFGGGALTFPAPLRQPTANTALFVANVTTGANVICSASGYKAP